MRLISIVIFLLFFTAVLHAQHTGGTGKGDIMNEVTGIDLTGTDLGILIYRGGNGKGDQQLVINDVFFNGSLLTDLVVYKGGTGKGDIMNETTGTDLGFLIYSGGNGKGDANVISTTETMSNFWRGAASNVWNNSVNWTKSSVPASGEDIVFDNAAVNHLTADGAKTIGNINFSNSGKNVVLGNFDVSMNGTATGAGSSSYFQTNGTGSLKRTINSGGSFTFPVGNSTYNPVSITNKTGTSDNFSARVVDAVYVNSMSGSLITTPHVNRTWHIDKANPTANAANGVDFVFQWNSTEELYGISSFTVNHHDGTSWDLAGVTAVSPSVSGTTIKTLTFPGYTGTFSPFAVGEGSSPLPVELVSFQANCIEQGVALTWQTASEHSSAYFDVERSVDNQHWNVLETVQAAGNSTSLLTYGIVDPEVERTAVYYRLKQVDFDGAYKLYDPISIQCGELENTITTYPNPSSDEGFQLLYGNALGERTVGLKIIDARGNLLYTKTLHLQTGVNVFNIHDFEAETGIYFLQILEEGKTSAVLKHMHNSMK